MEAWSLWEVVAAGGRRGTIDRWQQNQIASRIAHDAAADGGAELVVVKPPTVISHHADEVLRRGSCVAMVQTTPPPDSQPKSSVNVTPIRSIILFLFS